jgi:hypothetical protein
MTSCDVASLTMIRRPCLGHHLALLAAGVQLAVLDPRGQRDQHPRVRLVLHLLAPPLTATHHFPHILSHLDPHSIP